MGLFDRNNHDRDRGGWGGSPEYGGNRGGGFMGGIRRGWDRVENGVRDAFDRDDDDRFDSDRGPGYRGYAQGGYNQGGYGNEGRGGMSGRDFGAGGSNMGGWTGGRSFSHYDGDHGGGRGWTGGNRDWNASAGGGEELNRYGRDVGSQGNWGYRGTEGAWSTQRNHGRYDQDFGGPGQAWGAAGYDRDHGPRRGMAGGGMVGGSFGRTVDNNDRDWNRGGSDYRGRHETDAGDPFGDRASRTPFRVMRGGFDTPETDRGNWAMGNRANRLGPSNDYGTDYRGWNQGVGDEPFYNTQDFRGNYDNDFRGRERGRGRDWF
jgi:hypothetical protein